MNVQATIIAAAALVVAVGVLWRFIVAPVGIALWAAIVAAPQIANDLRDLPDLISELRALIADNIPAEILALKVEVAALKADVELLRSPAIAGDEGSPPEPFMIPMTPKKDDA